MEVSNDRGGAVHHMVLMQPVHDADPHRSHRARSPRRTGPRMRFRFVASCLLFALLGPAVAAQVGPATGHALLISDIHLDPLADPAIVKQLIASPVGQWEAL